MLAQDRGTGQSPNRPTPSETRSRFNSSHSSGQRTARQPTNFFRPETFGPSQERQALGHGRPHDSIGRRTDIALEAPSSARLLSTLSPGTLKGAQANSTRGHAGENSPRPNHSGRGQSQTLLNQLLFPLHKTKHSSPYPNHEITIEYKTVHK
jgi:hypothetical protein